MGNRIIKSRYLPERSYLYFRYPQANATKSIEFYLPMLENIEISESQKPNLATYDLIGRAGSLYSYLGSKSREFSVKFNITLPNILDYITNVGMNPQFSNQFRYFYNEKDAKKRRKEKFKQLKSDGKMDSNRDTFITFYENAKSEYFIKSGETEPDPNDLGIIGNFFARDVGGVGGAILGGLFSSNNVPDDKYIRMAVDALMLWVGVIRSSTVNNAQNISLSPPTIYINHGTMYQNIPCICTNYSIRINNNVGYDLLSMAPRQIEVNLNLSENRVGDFTEWQPFGRIKGENLAGWEAIIENGTMDPMNSTFGEYDMDRSMMKKQLAIKAAGMVSQSITGMRFF